ncbi:peptide-methionine (S)-S-oxide reductase MsrA [Stakelama tenebrarum]|uniref:Peptide methionine sulfoxide reductase MsrA n=1 Tax=Stakelama tenebrarum TaxID=2711215 RepID=A0A6G6Y0U4_9SPHN|nr:peptide-methionine (S)-S-oxide reductase MsrA [Sphingosinithalassobacter tenebrarum]QIG78519.1 peptide-methionine (S)-S-oxide reductase MsrA [Sphingosinithalassobacter tenebrarum]
MLKTSLLAAAGAAALYLTTSAAAAPERAVPIPAPRTDVPASGGMQIAVLAGGCFWGMEAVFEHVRGVRDVVSGYAGGTRANANYGAVSSETTRHAEAIRVTYDPRQVSYGTLLRIYFSVAHDPTQLNRQGPDHGRSYRSAIFPQSAPQWRVARAYIDQLDAVEAFDRPIVTQLESGSFFTAEAHHQDFYRRNPDHPYIVRWDKPKVAAFETAYPQLAR